MTERELTEEEIDEKIEALRNLKVELRNRKFAKKYNEEHGWK